MKILIFLVLMTKAFGQIPVVKENIVTHSFFKEKFSASMKHIKKFELILKNPSYDPDSSTINYKLSKKVIFDFKVFKKYLQNLSIEFKKFDHKKIEAIFDIGDYSHGKTWKYKFNCPKNLSCEKDLIPRYFVFDFIYETKNGTFTRKALMAMEAEGYIAFGNQEDIDSIKFYAEAMEGSYDNYKRVGEGLGLFHIAVKAEKRKYLSKHLRTDQWDTVFTSSEMDLQFRHPSSQEVSNGVSKVFNLPNILKKLTIKFNLEETRKVYENSAHHEFALQSKDNFNYPMSFYSKLSSTKEFLKKFKKKFPDNSK